MAASSFDVHHLADKSDQGERSNVPAIQGLGAVVTEDVAVVFRHGDGLRVGLVEIDAGDFLECFSVDVDDAFFDFQGVAGQADDALDPGLAPIGGIEEGDEIVAVRFAVAIGVLAHEDLLTRIERGTH